LKTALRLVLLAGLSLLTGCSSIGSKKIFLTVDFQKDATLRYKFISTRDIELDWGVQRSRNGRTGKKIDKFSESSEIVMAYRPIEVDIYGLTTIEAKCESVKARYNRNRKKDAVESLAGKSFTFTIDSAGKITDKSQLKELLVEAGKKAFRESGKRGKIKDPDMLDDFIATQWFLWDAVSSIKEPLAGVKTGQSWESKLMIPNTMVFRKARRVTYKLKEIRPDKKGSLAVITAAYSPADSIDPDWPVPYKDRFRVSGRFGLMRGFKVLELHGSGEEIYNIDSGRTEQYHQQYEAKIKASFALPLAGVNPVITIKQNLSMQLLEE